MWNPATLSLKEVIVAGVNQPTISNSKDVETAITVRGAGFIQGMTLVLLRSSAERSTSEIIPINEVTVDPGAPFQLTGKVNAVLKNTGSYDLLAWLPSPNVDVPAGASQTVNDVAVLENALKVISAA